MKKKEKNRLFEGLKKGLEEAIAYERSQKTSKNSPGLKAGAF